MRQCSILALVVAGSDWQSRSLYSRPKRNRHKLTVTAQLEKRDGSAAAGVKVYIFPYRDGNVLHGIASVYGKLSILI